MIVVAIISVETLRKTVFVERIMIKIAAVVVNKDNTEFLDNRGRRK